MKLLCLIKHRWKKVRGPRLQPGWKVCLRCHKYRPQ